MKNNAYFFKNERKMLHGKMSFKLGCCLVGQIVAAAQEGWITTGRLKVATTDLSFSRLLCCCPMGF